MKRSLNKKLLQWKQSKNRNPLILQGTRQTGKTYLIEEFGSFHFPKIHSFNFHEEPFLSDCFNRSLNPFVILENLSLLKKQHIDLDKDLIFFDEIGECPKAIESLKYFCEKAPNVHLIAAGSLLGVKLAGVSYPVGKVDELTLYPMDFEEFLWASGDDFSLKIYNERNRLAGAHFQLWSHFLNYYFTGGLPACVAKWFDPKLSLFEKRLEVIKIQDNLVKSYINDFSKHAGKINALHLEQLFREIPNQLAKVVDESVKRFRFAQVLPNKRSFHDLMPALSWLEKAGLTIKVFPIMTKPIYPFRALRKENIFKLYLFDIGILRSMLSLDYEQLQDQNYGFSKGYFAENYVGEAFMKSFDRDLYSWCENESEIEFIINHTKYGPIPVEVKSGVRTKSKSLNSYVQRYNPERTIKLVGTCGGNNSDRNNLVLPIYFANCIFDFL